MRVLKPFICSVIAIAGVLSLYGPGPAVADTINGITVNNLFIQGDERGINDAGVSTGYLLAFGGDISGGSLNYSGAGIFTATGSPTPTLTQSLSLCSPEPTNPNLCQKNSTLTAAKLNGTWGFEVQNPSGTATATFVLPSVATIPATPLPFPSSVTLTNSANGVNPTISWTLPAGTTPNAFVVQIYDRSAAPIVGGQAPVIFAQSISPTATSYTIPTTAGLTPGDKYSINFQEVVTRDGTANTNSSNILTKTLSFYDFTPTPGTTTPSNIALPMVDGSTGIYHFNVGSVGPDSVTYIDPAVATGFIYKIGAGDPNFATLLLPDLQGPDPYTITWDDGLETATVLGGDLFSFLTTDPLGVDSFTVTGIDPADGIDPSNTTAFVTGLTFVGPGSFTGTMTPITAVPEPGSLSLLASGLVGAVMLRRRRRTRFKPHTAG